MPTTRKESLYFGLIMCFGMVLFMTLYNFYLNDIFGQISFLGGITDFLIGFIVAIILDLYLVGPIAKKIAFKLTANTSNVLFKILTISTCMVIGMAFFMSIYGLITSYFHNGLYSNSIIKEFLSVFCRNFIVALPLQIIIMGPIVRFLFNKFIKTSQNNLVLKN
ncbi:DUF2798 domain-containing protein [Lysinibacillus fusiformis]|uniref:DUF2798 domain-containing protein n=1 Tax=Lysinibacillus fusiformis TaxID=28031 RepID=UPI0011BBF24B|nr:DUF2798 domain-containing protein [Lysinibacillus fusiformis]MCT6817135.1 DUF2798 domain-containing protein [Lysinibacillus fusiformis]MCT6927468.1 DUF2798 domain-containing protein [Lysinibacillus fusiformis]MCT6931804.1 DUF2798 domain-containing protein [Lysinibacillus fusiformis]QDZ99011.1 DUF2798 domain-containing protein [Lysinibacillus fusiformis]